MTHFCTTAVLPKCANSDGKKQTAYFFITFYNLNTCLTKVDEVIENKHLVDNYEKTQTPFRFKKLTNDPAVDIDVRQPNHGSIGVVGKTKVYRSEVDFFVRKRTLPEDLQVAEHRDFYPPRFQIFLAPSPKDPTLRGGRIKLKGARSDLQYDIYLDPPPSSIIPNDACVPENYPLGIDNLQEVRSQLINVAVKWKFIGLQLGLKADQLDRIYADNNDVESRLNGMLKDWLRRAYDTRVCGEPSWQKLSEGVGCRAGGNNPALARDILHLQTV
ncbi:hypothetical protein GBAR_LOCUS3209 [Geodia barretti]|uniref:Death domain-containing protein n=1 Tax=Geodia barretti TaxID=519541 RepID=A0AA35R2C7_GEOBA|nr:hypothetical protein GBAR_LOCUS3209 [Geodia barretti]